MYRYRLDNAYERGPFFSKSQAREGGIISSGFFDRSSEGEKDNKLLSLRVGSMVVVPNLLYSIRTAFETNKNIGRIAVNTYIHMLG